MLKALILSENEALKKVEILSLSQELAVSVHFGSNTTHTRRPIKISVPRFQQERCFAWYQRKYRRLVVRWERQKVYFDSFIDLTTIHIWIQRILLVG